MKSEKEIAWFLQTDYSDLALANLLVAAYARQVIWADYTWCLVGRSDKVTTRDVVDSVPARAWLHFEKRSGWFSFGVTAANRKLIPLIQAEFARREAGRKLTEELLKEQESPIEQTASK